MAHASGRSGSPTTDGKDPQQSSHEGDRAGREASDKFKNSNEEIVSDEGEAEKEDRAGGAPDRSTLGDKGRGGRSKRGFAAMDPNAQKEIAGMGGRAAHESGHAHEWNSDEAREAGRRGAKARWRDSGLW